MDQVKRASIVVLLSALLLGGCGSGDNSVPGHTTAEEKAIQEEKNLTPQQRIERIQNSPMPEGAKAAMIAKIKQENGIK